MDVVFYDITTFHFESNRADDLKEFCFSKAGKFNEVQVVMGLLIDMEGNPIGYDLFPGNTFDGNTLLEALAALKQRFSIRKIIFVADKAINSKKNLHLIMAAGYDYIVSARLKNSSKKVGIDHAHPPHFLLDTETDQRSLCSMFHGVCVRAGIGE